MNPLPLLAAALLAIPAAAQSALPAQPAFTGGAPLSVTMTNKGFLPERLTLKASTAYTLTFHNRSDRTHDFSAPSFFKIAHVAPRDAAWVARNRVELKPGQSATLHIVAPDTPGAKYDFRSGRLEDAAAKMKGAIYVR